ncbi:iron complex transport system ATP-binding protein [Sanguibacter gelidistatuariae]|uniref:Iron complex transport system ATP-binding protein n=1 Tax=Sanguibacter gelidistatuariae TaxID=1814289 RepID=A0A1G6UY19_9MICO|nr:ABC transporter ATP-binding protein [Sanguibacter gelidistatuariae]SDD46269.1 iron complex transport system ATP-binding protein [Sanguibacter gelidistatuariae]
MTSRPAPAGAPTPAAVPAPSAPPAPVRARGLRLAYDQRTVVDGLDVDIPAGSFTVIVGPNGCGKSTLLRALGRTLTPKAGTVELYGRAITAMNNKEVARRLALLPQSPIAPEAITVRDLVGRGRYPYQTLLRQWSASDGAAVREAMEATGTTDLADRRVSELSGGQRQRVWIAMVLAQDTDLLLLDEPTTFLDIAHQVDVLELCARMHEAGRTLVAVLHDLNFAARYATHMIAMRDGKIVESGTPHEVMTAENVEEIFGLRCRIIDDPESGTPLVVPLAGRVARG